MNIGERFGGMDLRASVSALWIFVLFNFVYADIISLLDPASPFRGFTAGGGGLSAVGLLGAAVLIETSIVMVVLSRVLKPRANRWANTVSGAINIVAVVLSGRGLYYIFFAAVEVAGISLIIWLVWKWKPAGASTLGAGQPA